MNNNQAINGTNVSKIDSSKLSKPSHVTKAALSGSPKSKIPKASISLIDKIDKNDTADDAWDIKDDISDDNTTREKTQEKDGENGLKTYMSKKFLKKDKWDDSPPQRKGRGKKEAEESEDDHNSDNQSSEDDDEIHSLNSGLKDEVTEGTMPQNSQNRNITQDNVIDLASIHSKYSK